MRFLVLAVLAVVCWAQDWPQWRGPNRDGVALSSVQPKAWPERLRLKWKVQVGEGYSSPIVAGGRIYLHTRQGEREVVSCLRPDNGQIAWQESYPAPYTVNPAAVRHGKGVKATPVAAGGRLYTFSINGILSCWDAQTGKLQWRKESGSPAFGAAMSPLVDQGLLIAQVGTTNQGAVAAFDAQTGAEKWSWKGDGPGYSSPIVVELEGTRQVVTQAQKNIVGVSVANGALLWHIPYTTNFEQNIVTPLVYGETLIFSGLNNGTMAMKVLKRGNEWVTERIWHNPDVSMYMNSPVLSGDLLFGFSHRNRGQFFCLDLRTGKTLWTTGGREGDNAAIVRAGGSLLLLTDRGELTVAPASGKGFEMLRRYTVADSPTWAHPVAVNGGILIKDTATLTRWDLN